MSSMNPYLNFQGNAEEAFNFYKSVFGGEFQTVMRFGDMPGCDESPIAENEKNLIMHISLPVAGGALMASDAVESMGQNVSFGNNCYICISPASREESDRFFNGLSEGGKVEMPMSDTFWGAYFGTCTDKFGVQWMINFDSKTEE